MKQNKNSTPANPTVPAENSEVRHAPQSDTLIITALVKKSGRVSGYQLSDGSRVTRDQGVRLAKEGKIRGVGIAVNQGTEYLRTLPAEVSHNKLSNLPSVTAAP